MIGFAYKDTLYHKEYLYRTAHLCSLLESSQSRGTVYDYDSPSYILNKELINLRKYAGWLEYS